MRSAALAGALACAIALLTSACAPLAPLTSADAAVRETAPAFELFGRVAATDGQQAASGGLEWRHDRGSDQWTVSTPLGQILARLDSDDSGARLLTADGQRLQAESAETLLPQLIGIDAPVDRLAQWVQATPAADAEVRQRDSFGRPALVIDRGWRIEYPAYADDSSAAAPARVDVSRGDARLRLIIDSWNPQP